MERLPVPADVPALDMIGYARVSTDGQSVAAQVAGLRAAGAGNCIAHLSAQARQLWDQLREDWMASS